MTTLQKALAAAVTALCVLTMAASAFLALSYITLNGVADLRPLSSLPVFLAQGGLTLLVLSGIAAAGAIDLLLAGGAVGLVWLGWSLVDHTLSSSHFEGYALVLGALGGLQGALTLALLAWRLASRASREIPRPTER